MRFCKVWVSLDPSRQGSNVDGVPNGDEAGVVRAALEVSKLTRPLVLLPGV